MRSNFFLVVNGGTGNVTRVREELVADLDLDGNDLVTDTVFWERTDVER